MSADRSICVVETSSTGKLPLTREIVLWLAAALAVRLLFFFLTPQVIDSADSILYLDATQAIAEGRFLDVYPRIPLLYPALAATASFAFPNVEIAGLVISLIAGTLLVWPVFALSYVLHGHAAARMSALIVLLWPWLVDYSCRVAPEALYSTLWFAALVVGVVTIRKGGARSLLFPPLLLALYLARPEGILLVCAILAALVIASQERRASVMRLAPSALVLIVAIPLHLWVMHILASRAGIPPRFSASSVEFSIIARGEETARTAGHLLVKVIPTMVGPILGGFALVGAIVKGDLERDHRIEIAVLAAASAQFAAAALSTFPEPRYVMTTILVIALWTARGATVLARIASGSRRRSLRYAPATIIVLMMLAGMWPNIAPPMLGKKSYKPLEYKVAGQWMASNLEPGIILSRKPQVGYYAKMPTSGPAPDDTLDDIQKRVEDAGMRYVVVDERYSTQMIPALRPLLEPGNAPSWLRLLKADSSPYPDARIVIYAVVGQRPAPR